MNIEDVKQIPIADYLHSLGYSPVKQQGNGLWYKSPLREEHLIFHFTGKTGRG